MQFFALLYKGNPRMQPIKDALRGQSLIFDMSSC